VIGRWRDDPTFPGSVWSAPAVRDPALVAERTARSREALALLKALLRERLSVVGLREFR
jgi:diadenosine tetraphosphate (Ap4A) HIT family hydrolase